MKSMKRFGDIFIRASLEILFFTMLFSATFFGFSVFAHNIYGASIDDFSTITMTIKTLLKMTVGMVNYEQMRLVDPVWTPIFFLVYILFIGLVMINVFLAILNTSYTAVREEQTAEDRRLKRLNAFRPDNMAMKEVDWVQVLKEVVWLPYAFDLQRTFVHPKLSYEKERMKLKTQENANHAWQL